MANERQSMGYPLMEKLVENENFDQVNRTFTQCYETLERMLKQKTGGLKRQNKVRQALKAYDLTVDLIRELLKIKYQYIKQNQQNQKDNPGSNSVLQKK